MKCRAVERVASEHVSGGRAEAPSFLRRLARLCTTLGAEGKVNRVFALAGVQVNGNRPWDVIVKDRRFFGRLARDRSIGLGDSYMESWWECKDLEKFFTRILTSRARNGRIPWRTRIRNHLTSLILNAQSRRRAGKVAEEHYNLGNELYRAMLDQRMVYTCGLWKRAATLDAAQEEKLRTVCEALKLRPGMRLLDIGCGWGSLAKFAAKEYGANVVGITISEPQAEFARKICEGLPVTILVKDYRDVCNEFDRVVSLGMFEHVGRKNYRRYFEIVRRALRPGGLFYLETIGSRGPEHRDDPWMLKHIFPNSHIPSWNEIEGAIRGIFAVEKREDWTQDYRRTVLAWLANFQTNWRQIEAHYDKRFARMWRYYLCASAAAFGAETSECWQVVFR